MKEMDMLKTCPKEDFVKEGGFLDTMRKNVNS